jgi:hypothetical protein
MRNRNCLWSGVYGVAIGLSGSALSGSASVALPTAAPTAAMPAVPASTAQLNPSPSIFNEPPFNRAPRSQTTAAPASTPSAVPDSTTPEQPPDTAITPVNSKVNIRFVNETGAAIDYEVVGQTQARTLAGRSEMALQDLTVPTTLAFRRQDKGFLLVTLQENNPTPGTLTLSVRETADFTADRTSLYIDQSGNVFLN